MKDKLFGIHWPKWYVRLSLIVCLLFMTYMWYISPVTSNHAQKRAIQKGFRGTVINKYIDGTDNHKQVVVAGGSDTSEFFTEVYEIDLYKYIKAGDSIVKLAGDSSLFVIRNNSRKRFRIEDW